MKLKQALNEAEDEQNKAFVSAFPREKNNRYQGPGRGYWVQNKKTGEIYTVYKPHPEHHQVPDFVSKDPDPDNPPNFRWSAAKNREKKDTNIPLLINRKGNIRHYDPRSDYWEGRPDPKSDLAYVNISKSKN
jgi:hypothetical protein